MSKEELLALIEQQSVHEQGSNDWFRDRLGCISSSNIHFLMGQSAEEKAYEKALAAHEALLVAPLKKTETQEKRDQKIAESESNLSELKKLAEENQLSDSAKRYLYKVAAERNLQDDYVSDDYLFGQYLERVSVSTKSIRYGSENEDVARKIYEAYEKAEVLESGFIRHMEIDGYGDSPDGTRMYEDRKVVRAIEIKFPNPDTWIQYAYKVHDAESLKEVKPEYYWQCMSHIECNDKYWQNFGYRCEACDFVFCDKMQKGGYRKVEIYPNWEDIEFMKKRVVLANKFIDEILAKIRKK